MPLVLAAVCLGGLVVWSCTGGSNSGGPGPARTWIQEGEFGSDAKLKAAPGTIVVLDLEPGTAAQRNSIPYTFEKSGIYNICIDENDPMVVSAVLVDAWGTTMASLDRGKLCEVQELPAGSYTLYVHHDGTAVGDQRFSAFVYPPTETMLPAVLALRGPSPVFGAAPGTFLSPTKGDKWIGRISKEGWVLETNWGWRRQRIFGAGTFPYPSFSGIKFRFGSMAGTSFQCSNADDAYRRDCCFIKGDNIDAGSTPKDVYIGSGDQCTSSSALRYELFSRDDTLFAINLRDSANKLYRLRSWSPLNEGEYRDPNDNLLIFTERMVMYEIPREKENIWETDKDGSPFPYHNIWELEGSPSFYYVGAELMPDEVDLQGLLPGQVVLYTSPNCSGTATVLLPDVRYDTNTWTQLHWEMPTPTVASIRVAHNTVAWLAGSSGLDRAYNGPPTTCRNIDPPKTLKRTIDLYRQGTMQVITKPTMPIFISSKQCRNCDLAGVQLAGQKLDGYDLSSSYLGNANLSNASLQGANLSNAVLSGAILNHANLKGANMCGTFLNGNPESGGAAKLEGAYMKNVNLAAANLSGAAMTNVNFYSTNLATSTCVPTACDGLTPWPARCATAAGAIMTGTHINNAYLTGADFSNIQGQGVNFSKSILTGANFRNAKFGVDPRSSASANFTGALLQGADFGGASAGHSIFDSAYVDMTGSGILWFGVGGSHTDFAGFEDIWQIPAQSYICVAYGYLSETVPPILDTSSICPSGRRNGEQYCSDGSIVYQGRCSGGGQLITEDCWSGTPRVDITTSLRDAGFYDPKCEDRTTRKSDPKW